MPKLAVSRKLSRRPLPGHAPALDHGVRIRDGNQAFDLLIDDEDGLTCRLENTKATPYLFANERSEALGGFI